MGKRKNKTEETHTFLGVHVDHYSVRSEAALNIGLRLGRPVFYDIDEPAYEFISTLTVTGKCTYPQERTEVNYEITFRGGEIHAGEHSLTLKDFQAKDEYGVPLYKNYRGESIPVFESPPGIAILNKRRGEDIWDSWIPVDRQLVQDMLITLTHIEPVYLSIHEKKENRKRWIQSISLQSTNPADE